MSSPIRPVVLGAAVAGLIAPAAFAGVGWLGSELALRPFPRFSPHKLEKYPFSTSTESVRFSSLDGTELSGWFVPAGPERRTTVILLHGYGNTRREMLPHVAYLHEAGYQVLLFDFRGRGKSAGRLVTVGLKEPLDVLGAIAFLRTRPDVDPDRMALQGVSLGASAGLMAMANDRGIRTIVVEGAFSDLRSTIEASFKDFVYLPPVLRPLTVRIAERRLGGRVDDVSPVQSIARLGGRPVFIIEGLNDRLIPSESGRILFDAATGPKQLWSIQEAGHAEGLRRRPDEYRDRVLAFYDKHL